ncbi:DNA-binding protein [Devosia insulae DS-56]|uniref:DNA-binding protein n=1 Tax=Devosia insulae DS-56 TaxID=1116389 RepID=A0A1E5XHF5_9HYPH|nr:hemolysin III family protein [Devosia insulae]OEO28033.1 DNA-binding protein [Devosia insulae DS-56]
MITLTPYPDRTWWHRGKPYSRMELIGDAAVHIVGLLVALGLGGMLLASSGIETALVVSVYVASLLLVLSVSLAFNLAPVAPLKRLLARFDQAAIFLLIAGTYTPLLALLGDTPASTLMLIAVWSAAMIGIGLKLIVPQHFGRLALLLYLGIGWSGLLIFQSLASVLPSSTLLLIIAGGVAYCSGIIFHLWERLHFHNVIWHCFVVLGASIHLWAVLDCMVLQRL